MKHVRKKSTLRSPFVSIRKARPRQAGRVALLLAGEIRTLDYCLQRQLDKISSTDRVHVFLSTWDRSMPSVRQNFRSWNPSIIRTGKQQELEFITPEDIKARFPRIDSISVLSQSATHELHDSLSKGTGPSDEAPEQVNAGVYVTLNQLLLLGNAITMMQAQEDLQSARFDYVVRCLTSALMGPNRAIC